jgi:hypothetical protein
MYMGGRFVCRHYAGVFKTKPPIVLRGLGWAGMVVVLQAVKYLPVSLK